MRRQLLYSMIQWEKKLKRTNKVEIKILQGSVVSQTVLGGLTIHPPIANFL